MKKRNIALSGFTIVLSGILLCGLMSWVLYVTTVDLLTQNVRKRLIAIATTAVVQINPHDVEALQVEQDYKKPEWERVVNQLKKIRLNNENIVFMYIFRRSKNDDSKMVFIADSHSLNPYANVDSNVTHRVDPNGDGIINDTDILQWPGQPYDPPKEGYEAYNGPTANINSYSDSWGSYFTGYAPIKDDHGKIYGILAVDVTKDDFLTITTQTLKPFLSFVLALIGLISFIAYGLTKIWAKHVDTVEELDKRKDQVLGMVTHQFRTPVTAISWSAETLLEERNLTKDERMQIHSIQLENDKMKNYVEMIMKAAEFSKNGKMICSFIPLNLNTFFENIIKINAVTAKQYNVEIRFNIPKNLPIALLDQTLTTWGINNLLNNSIKYTAAKWKNGGGKVELTVEMKGKMLFCSIKDNGIGIPEKDKARMFKELSRASNVGETKGTGFGLIVAKGAIESQGGKIRYESQVNLGTIFFVELPLNVAKEEGNESKGIREKKDYNNQGEYPLKARK